MSQDWAANVLGWVGVASMVAAIFLLQISRRNLEAAIDAWRQARRFYESAWPFSDDEEDPPHDH